MTTETIDSMASFPTASQIWISELRFITGLTLFDWISERALTNAWPSHYTTPFHNSFSIALHWDKIFLSCKEMFSPFSTMCANVQLKLSGTLERLVTFVASLRYFGWIGFRSSLLPFLRQFAFVSTSCSAQRHFLSCMKDQNSQCDTPLPFQNFLLFRIVVLLTLSFNLLDGIVGVRFIVPSTKNENCSLKWVLLCWPNERQSVTRILCLKFLNKIEAANRSFHIVVWNDMRHRVDRCNCCKLLMANHRSWKP